MGLLNFIKSASKKLGIGGDDDAPDADAVQKELASHGLGTDGVMRSCHSVGKCSTSRALP